MIYGYFKLIVLLQSLPGKASVPFFMNHPTPDISSLPPNFGFVSKILFLLRMVETIKDQETDLRVLEVALKIKLCATWDYAVLRRPRNCRENSFSDFKCIKCIHVLENKFCAVKMEMFKQWLSKLNQKMKRDDNCTLDSSMTDDGEQCLRRKSRSSEPNLKNCCNGNKFFRCYPNKACQTDNEDKDDMFRSNYLDCNCHNCMVLPSITECQVCLGPFQGQNVKSCITCGNLMCNECVKKIKFCAFCRSERPFQNNKAIERLFNELSLPCKNMRNGCNIFLHSDEKQDHEQKCAYSQLQCPMTAIEKCSWQGLTLDVFEHLKTAHQVVPLNGSGVTIELTDFWKKMVFAEGKYSVFLNCYYQLFLLKVDFFGGKIKIIVSRINYFTATDEKQPNVFEVAVKVVSSNDKSHYQKTYVLKNNKHTENIVIDCAALLAQDIHDSAKIEVVLNKNNP